MNGYKNNDFWFLLGEFFRTYPTQRNLSDNTVDNWRYTWNLFLDWLVHSKGIPLDEICMDTMTSQTVIEFLDSMTASRSWSPQTRNERLSMIRSFFEYVASVKPLYYNKVNELRGIKKAKCVDKSGVIDYIPKQAMTTLLSMPDPSTRLGCRDLFYMSLAYDIAARTAEMTGLRNRDFDQEKRTVILNGKGRKQRVVPVSDQVLRMHKQYLRRFHSDYDPEAYLFYTIHNGERTRMSSDTVSRFLNVYAAKAREICSEMPKRVHPHQAFRASRAMHMLQSEAPLSTVSMILGHTDPVTTVKHYAAADPEMKRKLMERAFREMFPSFAESEAIWENNKDIIGKLYLNK